MKMALEDRCSPQSAPSPPPGVPHSPFTPNSTSPSSCYDTQSSMQCDRSSPTQTEMSPKIKEENDEKIEIDVESRSQLRLINMNSRPQQTTFSFSISNILSDNFGKLLNNTLNSNNHLQHQHHHHNSHQKTIKPKPINSVLFRPYDCNDSIHANLVNKNNHVNSNNSINYNNQNNVNNSVSNYHHSNNNNSNNNKKNSYNNEFTNHFRITDIFNNYNNLFNGLSAVTSYPKIHEELLNNQKRYQKLDLSTSPSLPSTSISSAASPLSPGVTTSTCTTPNRKSSGQPRITESPLTSPIPQQSQSKNGSCVDSSDDAKSECGSSKDGDNQGLWPAWVYCTRYSDRPSSGPRYRRPKQTKEKSEADEKRPRTAFSNEQLARLKREFNENRYLTERRRQQLSSELGLNEAQIKIWFQNKRAKLKKSTGSKNPLALQLMAQGLYNHTTVPLTEEEEELEMRMNGKL